MTLIYIGFGIVVIASFITGIILTKKENKNSDNVSTNISNNEVSTLSNSGVQSEAIAPTSTIPVTDNSAVPVVNNPVPVQSNEVLASPVPVQSNEVLASPVSVESTDAIDSLNSVQSVSAVVENLEPVSTENIVTTYVQDNNPVVNTINNTPINVNRVTETVVDNSTPVVSTIPVTTSNNVVTVDNAVQPVIVQSSEVVTPVIQPLPVGQEEVPLVINGNVDNGVI